MKRLVSLAAPRLAGCQVVAGSGTVTSTTRDISAFRRVSIESGVQATVSTGNRSVAIRVDDNLFA